MICAAVMGLLGVKEHLGLGLRTSHLLTPTPDPFQRVKYAISDHFVHFQIAPNLILQPDKTQHAPAHHSAYHCSNNDQCDSPPIPTIHQDLQSRDVVDDDSPADRRRSGRQIVLPHYEQYRKQLGAGTDKQRGRQRSCVFVVRQASDASQPGKPT